MRLTLLVLSLLVFSLRFVAAETVTGKVVDVNGKPIHGANVCLVVTATGKPLSLVTDAEGKYTAEADLAALTQYFPGLITAYAPGYALTGGMLKGGGNVLTLRPGSAVSGIVVDAAGKPLAGIPIRLLFLTNETAPVESDRYTYIPEEWQQRFTATTAADGTWTLPGIPPTGNVSLALFDDRYVREQRDLQLAPEKKVDTVRFTARPAARITGRVLTPKGAPAAGTMVLINNPDKNAADTSGYAKTTADGTYHIAGLATGKYTISCQGNEQLGWAGDSRADVNLIEGKEITAPVLRMRSGALLEGTVVDADTGKPIPMTLVMVFQGRTVDFQSMPNSIMADANGHFRLCTKPGKVTLLIMTSMHGYLKQKETEALTVDLLEGKTTTVTLKLKKGFSITGTVTDREGKPVPGVQLFITMPNGHDTISMDETNVPCITDQAGHFTAEGLPAGKGTIDLLSDPEKPRVWAIPEALAFEVPAKGPLAVVVTRVTEHSVTGRVVDMKKHPLAGVTVTATVTDAREMDAPKELTAVTGADGCYHLPGIATGDKINVHALQKAGYRQPVNLALTNAGKDTLADAVMLACRSTIHGKVCDAGGKPVPGATMVSVEGGLTARATTDEMGAFTLANQPEGTLYLIAATPTGGGLATCAENATGVLITCTPGKTAKPTDIPLALQWLDADSKRPEKQRRFNRADVIHDIAEYDFALASKLALADDAPIPDGLRAFLLGKQAEKDPGKLTLVQLNLIADPGCKLYAAVEVGAAMAKANPELAEQLYQIARTIYDRTPHGDDIEYRTIKGLGAFNDITLRLFTLAGLLQKTADVEAMLVKFNAQLKEDERMGMMRIEPLLGAAGRVSPEFVLKVYDGIDYQFKAMDMGEAIRSMAQRDPMAAARLAQLFSARKRNDEDAPNLEPVIKALGKQDPAAALALAKTQPDNLRPAALLVAAASQPKAAAKALLQEVFATERNRTIMNLVKVNATDPDLAKEFYTQYKQRLDAESDHFTEFSSMDGASADRVQYAYLISSLDPVEARLIIETEYAVAMRNVPRSDDSYERPTFPQAMCALDLDRAQAMVDALAARKDFAEDGPSLQRWMMRYILMSREERVSAML